jgi:hypothetical protein
VYLTPNLTRLVDVQHLTLICSHQEKKPPRHWTSHTLRGMFITKYSFDKDLGRRKHHIYFMIYCQILFTFSWCNDLIFSAKDFGGTPRNIICNMTYYPGKWRHGGKIKRNKQESNIFVNPKLSYYLYQHLNKFLSN